tara:strand:- start:36 stop:644 length:609 start_codon:yes stop_codon:yes gene_type:complete
MKPLNKSDWITDPLVKRRLDEVWEVEGDYFKACFEEVIVVLKAHYKEYKNEIRNRRFITRRYKDMIGAHGIGKTFINIGLYTEDALNEKNKGEEIVKDHVFGYITIAKKVVRDFIDKKICKDENWLRKHFHLWLVINVSKEEHKKENILRSNQKNGDSIDYNDKLKLKHYMDVSNLHIRKDFEPKFANLDYKNELAERRVLN